MTIMHTQFERFSRINSLAVLAGALLLSAGTGKALGKPSPPEFNLNERLGLVVQANLLRAPGLAIPQPAADTLTQALEQHWDSSGWQDVARDDFFYDLATMRLAQTLTKIKSATGWADDSLQDFKYDAAGLVVEIQSKRWVNQSEWQLSTVVKSTYAAGKITEMVSQDYWGDAWHNTHKEVTSYTPAGVEKDVITQSWTDNAWVNESRKARVSATRTVTETVEIWKDSVWATDSRSVYTYGSNGYLTTILDQVWDPEGKAWLNSVQLTYQIQTGGIPVDVVVKFWENGAWENGQAAKWIYEGKRLKEFTVQRWEDSAWVNWLNTVNSYGPPKPVGLSGSRTGSPLALRLDPAGTFPMHFELTLPEGVEFRAGVSNLRGERVGSLSVTKGAAGNATLLWNGAGRMGGKSAPGMYFLVVDVPGKRHSLPFLLQR